MIKLTPEQQLGVLERDIYPLLVEVRKGFDCDPGHSDLDDEQPIYVQITLGAYRRASRLFHELSKSVSA